MIILTSATPPVLGDLFNRFLKVNNPKTAVFIETAAEVEGGDKQWLEDDYNSWVSTGLRVTRYSISGKDKETLEKELSEFDVIYVSGGNTYYLLQEMQKTGALEVIPKLVSEGRPYVGGSAGSVIAGPDMAVFKGVDSEDEAPELKGYKGLSMVDFVIFPHWGSPHFKDEYLSKQMEATYDNPIHKIVLLTDNQYVQYDDSGYMKIFDIESS